MTTAELERRVTALEEKIEHLAAQGSAPTNKDWLLSIWGSFADDPDFKRAMRYGRQWRESENRKSLRRMSRTRIRKHK